jgi:hypothetical protein
MKFGRWGWSNGDVLFAGTAADRVAGVREDDLPKVIQLLWVSIGSVWMWCGY